MFIRSLSLQNFRNIDNVNLDFSDRINVFVGDNGQGKTNILEAIFLLLEKESFRYSNNETLIQSGKANSLLNSLIHNNGLDFQFKLNLLPSKKEYFVNNKKNMISSSTTRSGEGISAQNFRAILFSPESLNVIKESADERRTLVDQMIASSSLTNATLVKEFRRALKSRNKLLKDHQQEKISTELAKDTLLSINPIYLDLALKLTVARLKTLVLTKGLVQDYLNKINQNTHEIGRPLYGFSYVFSENEFFDFDDIKTSIKIKQIFEKRAQDLMSAEMSSGTSLVGPHKHDIAFLFNGKDSRFYCSQGQQRSIILAFKMAQIVYHHRVHGFYPVLLLDDVLSELDQNKQEALISALKEINTQTFLTTTDLNSLDKLSSGMNLGLHRAFDGKSGKLFTVREGKVINTDPKMESKNDGYSIEPSS